MHSRPRAEALGQHAYRARGAANVERFPLCKTVTECGHEERSITADCSLDRVDQEVQTLFVRHRGKLRRHNRIGMHKYHTAGTHADRKQSLCHGGWGYGDRGHAVGL